MVAPWNFDGCDCSTLGIDDAREGCLDCYTFSWLVAGTFMYFVTAFEL